MRRGHLSGRSLGRWIYDSEIFLAFGVAPNAGVGFSCPTLSAGISLAFFHLLLVSLDG